MSDNLKNRLWLIGAGQMAMDYAKVLEALNVEYEVIGRGAETAKKFEKELKKNVRIGGLKEWCEKPDVIKPKMAIVAVGVEQLANVTTNLLEYGFKRILVEKPAGLNGKEIQSVANEAKKHGANVFVAYNRRFYSSTLKAKEIIEEDGGVSSFNFEFTEWSHEIRDLQFATGVKENWFLANSSHVVDLAFFLGGKPKEISCFTVGEIDWHPKASIFAGAGITANGALFSYQANWEAPGRWGVEVLTKKHRLIFRPMEKLQIQKIGSVSTEFVEIEDDLDIKYKPGLFKQVQEFIEIKNGLLDINEHTKKLCFYEKILEGAI